MKNLFAFAFLLFKLIQPDSKEIVGTWKVAGVVVDKNSPMGNDKKLLAYAKPIMLKTVFYIKADHRFKMQSGGASQQMPDGVWSYDNHMLRVSEPGNTKSRLAEIMVFKDKEGNTCFSMVETPFILKVVKQQ